MEVLASPRDRSTPEEMSSRYKLFRRMMLVLGRILGVHRARRGEGPAQRGRLSSPPTTRNTWIPSTCAWPSRAGLQWMGKKELFAFPFRAFFYFIGILPRGPPGRRSRRVADRSRLPGEGWALGIFPEGTHRTGEDSGRPRGRPRAGLFCSRCARARPVVPVFTSEGSGPARQAARREASRLRRGPDRPWTRLCAAGRSTGRRPTRCCAPSTPCPAEA